MRSKGTFGFTLIELMIVVAVVAVLAVIAFPAYQNQVRKARLGQAQADLLEISQIMERCFTANNSYVGCALPFAQSPRNGTAFYLITVATPSPRAYTLTATPLMAGGQAHQVCGTLRLNQLGAKSFTGSATHGQCW